MCYGSQSERSPGCQYERSEVVFMENDEERRTEVIVEGGT